MNAIPLPQRQTDVPTGDPANSAASPPQHPLSTAVTAIGSGIGAMAHAAQGNGSNGGGGMPHGVALGMMFAGMIGAVLWMNARVDAAERAFEAANEKLATYDARMVRIELSLDAAAQAAKDLPEIKRALERLVDDQRMTAGALASIERVLREEKTP
jgi:hypothetical protein